jgi:hypothetical protein
VRTVESPNTIVKKTIRILAIFLAGSKSRINPPPAFKKNNE